MCVQWYLIVTLNLYFPCWVDIKHFFMYLFIIHMSMVKSLFKSLAHLEKLNYLDFYYWVERILYMFCIQSYVSYMCWKIFFQSMTCLFIFLNFFWKAKVFNLIKSNLLLLLSFLWSVPYVCFLRNLCQWDYKDFHICVI